MGNKEPATKEDIKIVLEHIKEVKTDVKSLHNKFDTLNYRTAKNSGIITVHTTLIILLIATLITKIAGII